jgi:preprotein translocase subunit SecG
MKKVKEYLNTSVLTKIIIALAVLLTLVALFLVISNRAPISRDVADAENTTCKTVVVVSAGDTLSGI